LTGGVKRAMLKQGIYARALILLKMYET
jgi:hypothetical protein